MALDAETTVRLVARDGSYQLDVTDRSSWEFSSVRSGIGESFVNVDMCHDIARFRLWCDLLEFSQPSGLLTRHVIRSTAPQQSTIRVAGVGLLAQLSRRRYPLVGSSNLSGFAVPALIETLQQADQIEPLLVTVHSDGADQGRPVLVAPEPGGMMFDTFDELAGIHVVVSEHAGAVQIRAIGDEDIGPTIRDHWLNTVGCLPAEVDGDSTVNEIAVAWGLSLDRFVTWPPNEVEDPNRAGACRLQSPVIEYPEIGSAAEAYAAAETAHRLLSQPQIVLAEQSVDAAAVEWAWLRPGRNHPCMLSATSGIICNLSQVDVQGDGERVTAVTATWDQADIGALRNRVRART